MFSPRWREAGHLYNAVRFVCGYCDHKVASDTGWQGEVPNASIPIRCDLAICPNCGSPTYLLAQTQTPRPAFGESVEHLPEDIASLYGEARLAMSQEAWTAAVLVGRKLLMNVAATQGATGNLRFVDYIDYLIEKGYVAPNMRLWVDQIRLLGNEATHELPAVTQEIAEKLMTFLTMLLKLVFEFPARAAS